MNQILNVLLLSTIASLGTGLGGLIAVLRRPGRRSFGLLMGVTAGVMISLSFMELVAEAWEMGGYLTATIGFAVGASFMFIIDTLIPHMRFGEAEAVPEKAGNPPANAAVSRPKRGLQSGGRLWFGDIHPHGRRGRRWLHHTNGRVDHTLIKSGVLIAIGITIHNMPEGIAVGAGYAHQPQFGIFIATAIALHNIPEGIATALPLCKGGVCRWDAFRTALLSGLTEPFGALVAILFLSLFQSLVPAALAFAGGVMTFITLDELIPMAREHGHQHWTAIGIILGAVFVFLLSGFFGV